MLSRHPRSALSAEGSLSVVFADTAATEIYTLSLHDALPISAVPTHEVARRVGFDPPLVRVVCVEGNRCGKAGAVVFDDDLQLRSEEHTPELQSRQDLECRLLLEKKKEDCTPVASVSRFLCCA